MRDASAGLLPDFFGGGAIVRLPIRRIAVLIWVEVLFRFRCDDLMNAANCAVGAFVAGSNNELGPQSVEDALALVRGTLRQAEFHRIAEGRADHGIGNSRIAAGSIDDRLAGAQGAAGQTILNHAQRGSVLDGSSRIAPLRLGVEFHVRKFTANSREP